MTPVPLGIDYGVRRVAVGSVDPRFIYDIKVSAAPGEPNDPDALDELYRDIRVIVSSLVKKDGVLVAIESPIQGASANIKTGLRLAQVAGAIQVACRHAGAATLLVAPSEWKKAVVGVGNAGKDQVDEWLAANHPHLRAACHSQDAVDATCLALHAQAVLAR